MNTIDIDKFYVSPYDKFLRNFDSTHELTESQMKEIEKHQRIAYQRDHQINQDSKDKIWAGF